MGPSVQKRYSNSRVGKEKKLQPQSRQNTQNLDSSTYARPLNPARVLKKPPKVQNPLRISQNKKKGQLAR